MKLSAMDWINVFAFVLAGLAGYAGWTDFLDVKIAHALTSGLGLAVSALNLVAAKVAGTAPAVAPVAPVAPTTPAA